MKSSKKFAVYVYYPSGASRKDRTYTTTKGALARIAQLKAQEQLPCRYIYG